MVLQFGIHKRIKHPELDILNIGLLKVGIVYLTHDTAPSLLWVQQIAIIRINKDAIKIVRATLLRIE